MTLHVGTGPRCVRRFRTELLVLAALVATVALVAWVTAVCLTLGPAPAEPTVAAAVGVVATGQP